MRTMPQRLRILSNLTTHLSPVAQHSEVTTSAEHVIDPDVELIHKEFVSGALNQNAVSNLTCPC